MFEKMKEYAPRGWPMYFAFTATIIAVQVGLITPRDVRKTQTANEVAAVRAGVAEWIVEINDDQPVRVFRFKSAQEISNELYAQKLALKVSVENRSYLAASADAHPNAEKGGSIPSGPAKLQICSPSFWKRISSFTITLPKFEKLPDAEIIGE